MIKKEQKQEKTKQQKVNQKIYMYICLKVIKTTLIFELNETNKKM